MATSYPTGLDSLTNPTAGDSMQSLSHAGQHANANDAIEAIQAVLGLSPQGGSASVGARCAALESGKASLSGSVSFGGTVGGTGLAGSLLSSASPVMNGTASAGTGVVPSRQDHVHPSDTSRAALSGATFTGDVTVSKATARLVVEATSDDGYMFVGAAADKYAGIGLRTGSSPRWALVKSKYGEPGSNVGSDLLLTAYNDAGASLGTQVSVERANGRVTLFNVGATGGLALGSSGPRVMSGTGSPEGVVTAPPGSSWLQTNATNDVKGWIRWNKATGTGSSGWEVGPEYDTGWRDMTAVALLNGWTAGSRLQLRRLGNTVRYNGFVNAAAATNRIFYFLPAGFRPANWEYLTVLYGTTIVKALETYLDGQMSIYSYGPGDHYISTSWLTTNAAPATLPGTL